MDKTVNLFIVGLLEVRKYIKISRLFFRTGTVARQALSAEAWALGFQQKRKHLERELELVESAYHLARKRYREKTGTFTDLRDAQAMFFQVWEQAISARYEERLAIERLKIAAGDFPR